MPKAPISIPRSSGQVPVNCDFCGAQNSISEKTLQQEVTIQGEIFWCLVPRCVCSKCEANFSTVAQADKAIEVGVAAYQEAHGLLTAAKIKEARESLGLTQQELADRAKVGIASVKRWERGRRVQTAANDQALRAALSVSEDYSDLVIVSVTHTRLYTIGELKSFGDEIGANPEAKDFKSKRLHPAALDLTIADQPLLEDCYA